VGKAICKGVVVLMQNHGVVVGGNSLRQAANHLEVLERTAQTLLWCQAVGRKPKILPKDVVKMLGEMGDMIA
jgi:ribulose-5-phosphate 4-epimerase/fuculose-1-phosphate aldolase